MGQHREEWSRGLTAHQSQRRPGVTQALNQHVEDLALVIDGARGVDAAGAL
jgi:hypothetical protein